MDVLYEIRDISENEDINLDEALIDVVGSLLISFPDPKIERMWRDYGEYYANMGPSFALFLSLMYNSIESFELYIRKRILMASRIKRFFKRSISDPSYKMCRDRLNKEFGSLKEQEHASC